MTFKEKVEARYQIEAGIKDVVKKVAQALAGIIFISQTAFGFNLKDPKKLGSVSEKMMKEYAHSEQIHGRHTIETTVKQVGGAQIVLWKFKKNGVTVGEVQFLGTQTEGVNSVELTLTKEGKEDPAIYETAQAMKEAISDKIKTAH